MLLLKKKKYLNYFILVIGLYLIFLLSTFSLSARIVTERDLLVTKVIDGDTILVKPTKKDLKIRLLGINAPEISTEPMEPFALESKNKLEKMILNKKVIISYDNKNKYDKYKRILAHIYLQHESSNQQIWLNEALVSQGLARVYIINNQEIPNLAELLFAENQAIKNNKGLWSNKKNQPILPKNTSDYLNRYAIVKGKILNVNYTKNSLWLQMERNGNKGFSIRVDKKLIPLFEKYHNIKSLLNKEVLVRGFIDKYSPNFGAFINLQNPFALELVKNLNNHSYNPAKINNF